MKALTRYVVGDVLKGNYTYESYLSYDAAYCAYIEYAERYMPTDELPDIPAADFFYIKKITEEVILGGLKPND